MIRILRNIAVVLTLCLVPAASCSTATDTDAQPTSFLWQVSSDVNTVYILGSVHIARADLYPLKDVIEDAYERSESLVVEVDDTEMTEEEMNALLTGKGMYPPGDDLKRNTSDDLYSRLASRLMEFDSSGALLSALNSFEPWVVAVTIADLDYMKLGYVIEYGIETYFLDKARADGKSILELESAELQLGLFDSLSDELQIMMLEDAVENPITEEEAGRMFDAWGTGDTAEMEQMVFETVDERPEYRLLLERILDERNLQMVEKIDRYLQGDDVHFVVVGAAHLVGENGIISLLARKGYEVRQQ